MKSVSAHCPPPPPPHRGASPPFPPPRVAPPFHSPVPQSISSCERDDVKKQGSPPSHLAAVAPVVPPGAFSSPPFFPPSLSPPSRHDDANAHCPTKMAALSSPLHGARAPQLRIHACVSSHSPSRAPSPSPGFSPSPCHHSPLTSHGSSPSPSPPLSHG